MKVAAPLPVAFGLALALVSLAACGGLSGEQAVELVRRYNAKLIEAYRASDEQLAAGVCGPGELKKLAGLIAVKRDAGLALDSRLLSFEVRGVDREGAEVVVRTEERWYYRDRRIGSGEQVGQDSTDHYLMRYRLRQLGKRWVVDRVEWAAPPRVGRPRAPLGLPADGGIP